MSYRKLPEHRRQARDAHGLQCHNAAREYVAPGADDLEDYLAGMTEDDRIL